MILSFFRMAPRKLGAIVPLEFPPHLNLNPPLHLINGFRVRNLVKMKYPETFCAGPAQPFACVESDELSHGLKELAGDPESQSSRNQSQAVRGIWHSPPESRAENK
jgi:hypothetical protein